MLCMTVNDKSALRKIRGGDIRAFEKLFRYYYEPLCRYAVSFTKDMEVAEEIVQDLFYRLWKEREQLCIRSLKSYLYGAVRNNGLQYLKHLEVREKYREKLTREIVEANYNFTPLDKLEYQELEERIAGILGTFPERRQQIFRMHRLEGKKYAEIARELSVSVKTVEAEISEALKVLRKLIGEKGY